MSISFCRLPILVLLANLLTTLLYLNAGADLKGWSLHFALSPHSLQTVQPTASRKLGLTFPPN